MKNRNTVEPGGLLELDQSDQMLNIQEFQKPIIKALVAGNQPW
jgi:hypothetical protein